MIVKYVKIGGVSGHCHGGGLIQVYPLLSQEVMLQLHVGHSIDEEAEQHRLLEVLHLAAVLLAACQLHLALPGLGPAGGQDSVEFGCSCLGGLLCDTAGHDVGEQHFGHIFG